MLGDAFIFIVFLIGINYFVLNGIIIKHPLEDNGITLKEWIYRNVLRKQDHLK